MRPERFHAWIHALDEEDLFVTTWETIAWCYRESSLLIARAVADKLGLYVPDERSSDLGLSNSFYDAYHYPRFVSAIPCAYTPIMLTQWFWLHTPCNMLEWHHRALVRLACISEAARDYLRET